MARSQKMALTQFGLKTAVGDLVSDSGYMRIAHNVVFPAAGRMDKTRGYRRLNQTLPVGVSGFQTGASAFSVISSKTLGQKVLINSGNFVNINEGARSLFYGDGVTTPWWGLDSPDQRTFLNFFDSRMKNSVNLKNLFLTTARTPVRIESGITNAGSAGNATDQLTYAGMPQAPGFFFLQQVNDELTSAAPNWLAINEAVAYRVVFGVHDADGNERLSPPSGRYIIANLYQVRGYDGNAKCPVLNILLPKQTECLRKDVVPTDVGGFKPWFVRVYRSQSVNTAVGANGTWPNDELQLCFEKFLTEPDVRDGYFTFVDRTPPQVLTSALYTNQNLGGDVNDGVLVTGSTGLGLVSKNDRPPIAQDTALFADCTMWANIKSPYRLILSLLGVQGTGDGPLFGPGDTFTIQNRTSGSTTSFTAVNGIPSSYFEFHIESGYGSVGVNTRQTVMNLVSSINSHSMIEAGNESGMVATYIGNDNSPGTIGQFMLETIQQEWNPNGIALEGGATTSRPDAWLPRPMQTKSFSWPFERIDAPNGIAISKPLQGDAVPPVNYVYVGRADTQIQRIIPTTNALYILCDDGIYWLRGTSPANFQIERLDPTCRIWFRESAVSMNDSVYLWAREGLFKIQNGSTIRLDADIRNLVESIRFNNDNAIVTRSNFAFANPFDNTVTFAWANWDSANLADGGVPYQALVWNENTGQWSSRDWCSDEDGQPQSQWGWTCATARWSDGALYLGQASGGNYDGAVFSDLSSGQGLFTAVYFDANNNLDFPTNRLVTSTMEWVTSVPNPGGMCHWSEFQAFSQPGSIVYSTFGAPNLNLAKGVNDGPWNPVFPLANYFQVQISSEEALMHTDVVVSPTSPQGRVFLGTQGGYAARQIVRLIHRGDDGQQPIGVSFTGFSLLYRQVSGRTTR